MDLSYFAVIGPSLVVSLAFLYRFLRLPKQDPAKINSLFYRGNSKPVVFAHRAGQHEAPENTLIAIETAYKNGATAVEIDLDFTKDGVPVVFHDDTVDRVTDGKGKVSAHTYSELLKLNAAAQKTYVIQNHERKSLKETERIPTLYEAVQLCLKNGMTVDLDVKSNAKKTVKALRELLKRHPNDATDRIFVSAFDPTILYEVRKECPQFAAGLIWRHDYFAYTIAGSPRYGALVTPVMELCDVIMKYLIHEWIPNFLGLSVMVMKKDHLSQRYIDKWRRQGIEIVAWTVNSPLEKQYMLEILKVPVITDSILNLECGEQNT